MLKIEIDIPALQRTCAGSSLYEALDRAFEQLALDLSSPGEIEGDLMLRDTMRCERRVGTWVLE